MTYKKSKKRKSKPKLLKQENWIHLAFRVDPNYVEQIDLIASKEETSRSQIARKAISEYLKKYRDNT